MPRPRRTPPGAQRPRPSARACQDRRNAAHHLSNGSRRHPDVGSGHESRGDRVSDQAVSRTYAIDRDRTARAERHELAELRRRYDTLTPRERDVMAGVGGGLLNKHMSAEFGTTEATVKEQRGQVMQKMRAGSLAELVRTAPRLGITPAGSGPTPPRSGRRLPPSKLDW